MEKGVGFKAKASLSENLRATQEMWWVKEMSQSTNSWEEQQGGDSDKWGGRAELASSWGGAYHAWEGFLRFLGCRGPSHSSTIGSSILFCTASVIRDWKKKNEEEERKVAGGGKEWMVMAWDGEREREESSNSKQWQWQRLFMAGFVPSAVHVTTPAESQGSSLSWWVWKLTMTQLTTHISSIFCFPMKVDIFVAL